MRVCASLHTCRTAKLIRVQKSACLHACSVKLAKRHACLLYSNTNTMSPNSFTFHLLVSVGLLLRGVNNSEKRCMDFEIFNKFLRFQDFTIRGWTAQEKPRSYLWNGLHFKTNFASNSCFCRVSSTRQKQDLARKLILKTYFVSNPCMLLWGFSAQYTPLG